MKPLFISLVSLMVAAAAGAVPNVVLIVSDDQGYADISCYPHPDEIQTPNLDRIAREGARMTSGYASCPVCAPTRAGLLTGRYHQRFGFYTAADSRAGLPRSETTLAEVLGDHGYATGAFGKWHLGYAPPFRPLERGFDTFYGFLGHGGHDYFDLAISDDVRSIYRNRSPIDDSGYLTRNITKEAIAFIEENRDRPLFAYVPYNAVHNPLQAPQDYVRRYASPDPQRSIYLAMLAIMDEGVGAILDTLDRLDLSHNTLVIFLSDNGGARGTTANNGALRNFKHSVYEGGLRVPFLARWPERIPAGTVSDEPVISIDVFSTVLAAAGIEPPDELQLDSRDMLPALAGRLDRPLHEALYWNWIDKDSDTGWAIRKGRWKLLADKGGIELYDLEADIGETRNLASNRSMIVQTLLAEYKNWQSQLRPRIRRQR
ncbi:MAG: sulfatase-like hydrolase/transferase [Acidobacteriia bacterium]|nr:sulfatase-like hydrolase/transferase [Terriglobia bacterium]MYB51056.1 sulfatase-like hydrolase/transferase [Terriglobia bacterium]MYG01639.1 sulfatase-like hydrolase/transferase [Terriglobia bacterium]MYK11153.1 sulfatase-like hydrolase/transferase [Terriglobia bacterium]